MIDVYCYCLCGVFGLSFIGWKLFDILVIFIYEYYVLRVWDLYKKE